MVGSGKIILIQLDPDPQLSLCTVAVDVQYGEELLHFSSVVDPELFIPDPDPGKSFGSDSNYFKHENASCYKLY